MEINLLLRTFHPTNHLRILVELHGGQLQVGGPKVDEAHIILALPAERLL